MTLLPKIDPKLVCRPGEILEVPVGKDIREWDTGGKRDTEKGKLDYEGFLSPIVLERFALYMHPNRKMKDGSYRDSDNWQQGFGTFREHARTCMKSLMRHFMDVWRIHRCDESVEATLEDALCGVMFNAMAWLHRLLKSKRDFNREDYIKDLKKVPGSKAEELENNAENTM